MKTPAIYSLYTAFNDLYCNFYLVVFLLVILNQPLIVCNGIFVSKFNRVKNLINYKKKEIRKKHLPLFTWRRTEAFSCSSDKQIASGSRTAPYEPNYSLKVTWSRNMFHRNVSIYGLTRLCSNGVWSAAATYIWFGATVKN